MNTKKSYKSAVTTAATVALSYPWAGYTFENGALVAPDGQLWDYRPFGQSLAARRGRVERQFKIANAWKVQAGFWSKKKLRANARIHARLNATAENTYGAKYLFRAPTGETIVGVNPD